MCFSIGLSFSILPNRAAHLASESVCLLQLRRHCSISYDPMSFSMVTRWRLSDVITNLLMRYDGSFGQLPHLIIWFFAEVKSQRLAARLRFLHFPKLQDRPFAVIQIGHRMSAFLLEDPNKLSLLHRSP